MRTFTLTSVLNCSIWVLTDNSSLAVAVMSDGACSTCPVFFANFILGARNRGNISLCFVVVSWSLVGVLVQVLKWVKMTKLQ